MVEKKPHCSGGLSFIRRRCNGLQKILNTRGMECAVLCNVLEGLVESPLDPRELSNCVAVSQALKLILTDASGV